MWSVGGPKCVHPQKVSAVGQYDQWIQEVRMRGDLLPKTHQRCTTLCGTNWKLLTLTGFPLSSVPHTATRMVFSNANMISASLCLKPINRFPCLHDLLCLSGLILYPSGVWLYWPFSPFSVQSQGLGTCSSFYWEWAFPPLLPSQHLFILCVLGQLSLYQRSFSIIPP